MKIFRLNYYRVFFEILVFVIAFVVATFLYDPNVPGIVSSPNKLIYDFFAIFWFVPGLLAIRPIYRFLFYNRILIIERDLVIKRRWINDKIIPLKSEDSYDIILEHTPVVPNFYSLIITTAKNRKKKFSPLFKSEDWLNEVKK